jgi:hypothetical protein
MYGIAKSVECMCFNEDKFNVLTKKYEPVAPPNPMKLNGYTRPKTNAFPNTKTNSKSKAKADVNDYFTSESKANSESLTKAGSIGFGNSKSS